MIPEIKRLFDFYGNDREGKISRNRVVIIFGVFILLLLFNRFFFSQFISDNLRISLTQSRLLFLSGKSPYDEDVQNYILGIAREEEWNIDESFVDLEEPAYELVYYFPFALIGNYQWAGSVFLTVNQMCTLLIIGMLFHLLEWRAAKLLMIGISLACASSAFFIGNQINTSLSIIQLCLIVATLFFEVKKKSTISGVILGFSVIQPLNFFIFYIIILIIFINQKKYKNLVWATITISLMIIFSFSFINGWIKDLLKTLFLTPTKYPFLTYSEAINTHFALISNKLINGIPTILMSWMMVEILRTPKTSIREWVWLLSLGAILNNYIMIQGGGGASVLFIFPLVFSFTVWWEKVQRIGKVVLESILLLFTSTFSLFLFTGLNSIVNIHIEIILLIMAIIFIINIYWSRRWVINPYLINN